MKPRFFATPSRFRAWLEKHHAAEKELIVGFYKKRTGRPSITWPQAVDEALSFGWIDGVRRSLGDVAELTKLGRMMPAGARAFKARTPERTGVYSFERNIRAKLTPDEERELRANARAAVMAPPIGSQEIKNMRWLMDKGRAVPQYTPRLALEWLTDMFMDRVFAEKAFSGFIKNRKLGVYKIREVLETGSLERETHPLGR